MLTFPFGEPIRPIYQKERTSKSLFVLGVYASAVHARWVGEKGSTIINAVAVASEPEIFWRGDGAGSIISEIAVPQGAGQLVPASRTLNGPSGKSLDGQFLEPLGLSREKCWLCDLLPESRCNPSQGAALAREYIPRIQAYGLPAFEFPSVPKILADEERVSAIVGEILDSSCDVVMTLGDQPLKWLTRHFGSASMLSAYGENLSDYGRLHDINISGRSLKLLPLVHPRQAGRLGAHSAKWSQLHHRWISVVAPGLLGVAPA